MSVHLVVDYTNGSTRYYPIDFSQGWRIDTTQRMLVIGKGVPRIHVPLDNIISIEIEECGPVQIEDPDLIKELKLMRDF